MIMHNSSITSITRNEDHVDTECNVWLSILTRVKLFRNTYTNHFLILGHLSYPVCLQVETALRTFEKPPWQRGQVTVGFSFIPQYLTCSFNDEGLVKILAHLWCVKCYSECIASESVAHVSCQDIYMNSAPLAYISMLCCPNECGRRLRQHGSCLSNFWPCFFE